MTTFLTFIGGLAFLFAICYFVALMGTHGSRKQDGTIGCAVIIFVGIILFTIWKGISQAGYELHVLAVLAVLGVAFMTWLNWDNKKPGG